MNHIYKDKATWPDGSLKDYTDALQELIERLK